MPEQDWLTRNMFLREVENPTDQRGMMSPQFGGSPEQLAGILQQPGFQQQMQQFLGPGYHFDPNQIRQSPFFPNSFMQHHPMLGGMLNQGMANAAATPEAPMVSGAGSGISRAFQGMAGGPEMLRQYQIRQMMAPMQAAGGMMPMMEFQRKQQLMNLLQHQSEMMEEFNRAKLQHQNQQPIKTPYGLVYPGHDTGLPPEMQGQTPQSVGLGSHPLFQLFGNQGQQPFQQQTPPSFQPYDPNMIQQQTDAAHPERGATKDLRKEQTNTEKAKQGKLKAEAGKADRWEPGQGRGGRGGSQDYAKFSKQYNDAEKQYQQSVKDIQLRLQAKQIDQQTALQMMAEADSARENAKANIDKAHGDPGASKRGFSGINPGAGQGGPQQAQPQAGAQQQQQPMDPWEQIKQQVHNQGQQQQQPPKR